MEKPAGHRFDKYSPYTERLFNGNETNLLAIDTLDEEDKSTPMEVDYEIEDEPVKNR